MQLGLENKKKAMWAAALGVVAFLALSYVLIPLFTGSSASAGGSIPAIAPVPPHAAARGTGKNAKKLKPETLDPTLQLQLLASSEDIKYSGLGRNIFVSSPDDVVIQQPKAPVRTDAPKDPGWQPPVITDTAPPIPLKFFGFSSKPGEPKKIFLAKGEDIFVAGEGEIVDRRYKVIRISNTSVEMQDVVNSGPTQTIPLTQG